MTDTDLCGHPTSDETPCQHPASEDDGKCWMHTDDDPEPGGRPSKLESMGDTERSQFIADLAHTIEQGGSISEACRKSTIHRETFGRWMQRGQEADEGPYREFYDRLVRAQGEGEARYRQMLMEMALETDDTATVMAMLKQRYPNSWGDVDRGEQAGGVVVNVGDAEEHEIDPDTLEVQE